MIISYYIIVSYPGTVEYSSRFLNTAYRSTEYLYRLCELATKWIRNSLGMRGGAVLDTPY